MLGNVVVRTGPSAEPISLAEARLHCKVDSDLTEDDTLIAALIATARAHAESATNRVMVTQGLRATFPCWPDRIDLRAPLRKVTSITYLDTAGESQTLDAADYVVDLSELPGVIVPAYSACWPDTYEHPAAVTVNFISGHATPFTADSTTDILTAAGHPLATGDVARVWNTGGALPTALAVKTDYYAIGVSGNAMQLSATSGGAAINLTGAGSGTNFLLTVDDDAWMAMRQAMLLLIGHWYIRREATSNFQAYEVPLAVSALLAQHKVYGF